MTCVKQRNEKNIIINIDLPTIFLLAGTKTKCRLKTSLTGFVANQKTLPFWAINNKHGLIPNGNGALLEIGLFSDFTNRHKIQFAYGISAAGFYPVPTITSF
mgnify:CR=1 FL=1